MSKDFAWQLFKNTGNVDAYMIMKEYEKAISTEMATSIDNKDLGVNDNGYNKNKGDCN